jgi:hypothetical protein
MLVINGTIGQTDLVEPPLILMFNPPFGLVVVDGKFRIDPA